MALAVRETAAYRVATVISISGTAPASFTWAITEDGKIVSGYEPAVLFVFDVIADDGGMVRTGFVVREKGPHFTLEGSTRKLFTSLSALTAYHQLEGATVTMTKRFYNSAGSSEDQVEVVGKIVRIEDESAASKGFAVELRSEVANRKLPRVIAMKGQNTGLVDNQIPAESAGIPIPVPLGLFKRYLGPHFAAEAIIAWRSRHALHFRPAVIPCVEVYRDNNDSRFAYADYLPSGGFRIGDSSDTTYIGQEAAFVYIPEDDVYGWIRETGSNIVWDLYSAPWRSSVYTFKLPVRPWLTIPFSPPKVLSTSGASSVDPEKCINGEPFDYAEIPSGGAIYLEVPQPKYRGRISQNSVDGGAGTWGGGDGSDAPCGLSVKAVVVAPVGVPAYTAGTLKVEVVFPGDDTALFSLAAASISMPSTPGTANFGSLEIPYRNQADGTFGGVDDGWGGTKFHEYDFTSAPIETTEGDSPLWNGGSDGKTEPFRIKISVASSPAGRKVYVSDVKWCVGAHHNAEANKPETHKDGIHHKAGWSKIDYYGDLDAQSRRFDSERHAWDRGEGAPLGKQREQQSLKNVYASRCGYVDDGTIIGTSGRPLVNAVDQARYLLQGYGKETSFQTVAGLFGSCANAKGLLDKWAQLWGAGIKWESDFLQLSESDVNSSVIDLSSQAPGLFLCKSRIGAWLAHVWYPDPATSLLHDQYGTEINPLRCLKTGNGVALSFGWTDAGDIVNDLTINYGWDPGRGKHLWTATCNPTDYNDGQGGNWPLIFGTDPTALCDWSQGPTAHPRFGVRKKTIELHGVRDGRIATALGASVLARGYRKSPTLSMSTDAAYIDLQYGHLFTLNHNAMTALGHAAPAWAGVSLWSSVWWRCTHVEEQQMNGAPVMVIEAEWMPTTIGGEVSGFAPDDEGGSM